ncbi:MAG: HAMP domain-containing sensor histidine kinase, partial [Candidatus Hydrothermarchaeaceae archaeon]
VEINASIIEYEGRPADMAIIRDITERKQAEQAIKRYTKELEEAGRMKDLFTDIMRHDILNPVGIIMSIADLGLDDSPEDEELKTILRNTHRVQDIIDNAATLSRLKDVEELEKEELDLKEIVDGVCEDLTPALQAAGMELENKVADRMPIKANQILKDVFLNLLSNTVKYAPEGKKVVIEAMDEGENYVVAVKDYGPGVSDEDKEGIFERFMRVKKAGVKGTGLGLTIVKKLMELHKGIAWVEDNPEGGSIFYVKIPKIG